MRSPQTAAGSSVILRRGGYATLLSAAGGGCSSWEGLALTRWSADRTRDADGLFVYLRDLDSGRLWSAGFQPVGAIPDSSTVRLGGGRAVLSRRDGDLETLLEVRLTAAGDGELRRLRIVNHGQAPRRIQVTTCAELVLNTHHADAAHPAFSKLFVQTGWIPERQALSARRRLRSPDDAPLWAVHALRSADGSAVEYETDRSRFLGRGRSLAAPAALDAGVRLSGSVGNVLDPLFSLRCAVEVAAGATADLVLVLGVGRTEASVLAMLERLTDAAAAMAAFDGAAPADEGCADSLGVPPEWLDYDPLPPPTDGSADRYRPACPCGPAAPRGEDLQYSNGHGGFSADGREYVIRFAGSTVGGARPPMPWCNVIANEAAGFLVSESGSSSTWTVNSRENRLTPWSNDPVADPGGEALYLRDEETLRYWSPTPAPVPGNGPYEVRHGFGYTHFHHESAGLEQETTMFVPRADAVKVVRMRITNRRAQTRRLSAFSYAQWVLGGLPQESGRLVTAWHDEAAGALLASGADREEFAGRITFAAAVGGEAVCWTTDRTAFLGACGTVERPAAVRDSERLNGATGSDPCAALQVQLTIPPGETMEIAFLLGEGADVGAVREMVANYRRPGAVEAGLREVQRFWRDLTGTIQVRTPMPEIDLMTNGWLAYQNLSCRMWGRTAFYQSGGAYGFRDQLQDASALVHLRPELTRAQIVLHAAHQFVEGDVLHWWHPPSGKGIRTRFADDLLWLPYIAAFYVAATGDAAVLDERVRFLTGEPLPAGEDELFLFPSDSGETGDVYEHCCRAVDRSLTRGAHGLPLMGTGDWNDGMNRVGREGRGESVWLGFFLADILDDFIPLVRARGESDRAERYAEYRRSLGEALNLGGWDGAWYRRAYYDDGTPLGAEANDECRIDAIAQAWAVLSGVAPEDRARQALDALEAHLVSEEEGIIRLLTPAFDRTPHDPGYIKGYLPGVRENGGQYTHGALWAVRALAAAGRTERAARLLAMTSPVSHGRTAAEVAVYQAEPYAIAADVYGVEPHVGRAGWTWYTGSAGWMFRVAVESVLGLTLAGGDELRLCPCVPRDWPGFEIDYRPGNGTTYRIEVTRADGGEIRGALDGAELGCTGGALRIPLTRGGGERRVRVVLGRDFAPVYAPAD